ncbi:MAG: DUF4276 family protein [Aphanothece sp. CMT-3BRIN-NPC111]|nr:DUF4276 family protein [Aphanothece sp. CMT-3BRIN-NPC111]
MLPKILPSDVEFGIHSFQGKQDLLKKLPQRLKGYRSWLPDDWRILVLCDRDNDDCRKLKKMLEGSAILSGFTTKSSTSDQQFTVLNRIAIEELEAWFLGDGKAIEQAYPRVSATFVSQKRYRNPDAISGGTWEALQSLLQSKGYFAGGINKIEASWNISQFMEIQNNCSASFQHFYSGLMALIGQIC